jgi:4-hydroxy-2-oxoheptanedioate aldolase
MLETPGRGAWIQGDDPATARALAAELEWIAIDQQHGLADDRVMLDLLAATAGLCQRYVRVRSLDAGLIGRALDGGADGVIVPQVSSVAEARAAVAASHYPPRGHRSWGPLVEHSPEVVVGVMIETATGLTAVAEIAASGADLLFVGPYDLALSLGTTVDTLLDEQTALTTIRDAAIAAGVALGAYAGTPARAARFAALGYRQLAVTTDAQLDGDAVAQLAADTSWLVDHAS